MSSPEAGTSPLVSVVSPCFNQADYVGEMIRSVRSQTIAGWELIVVDNGSTDCSPEAALGAGKGDPRVRVDQTDNRGVAAARNYGETCASESSRYLLFLDADDVLEPHMLEEMTGRLEAQSHFGMAHCRMRFIDAEGQALHGTPGLRPRYTRRGLGVRKLGDDEPETPFRSILALAGIVPSAAVMRRSVYARTGGWDEAFDQGFEDTDLVLRMALEAPVLFVAERLVGHRRHTGQSSTVPYRHDKQLRKLHQRWRQCAHWPEPKASVVRDAWRFHDRQLAWAQARASARPLAAHGHPIEALRFLGGALRIALASWRRPPR